MLEQGIVFVYTSCLKIFREHSKPILIEALGYEALVCTGRDQLNRRLVLFFIELPFLLLSEVIELKRCDGRGMVV